MTAGRALSALFAILGPALVLGAAWREWTTPAPWAPNDEVREFDALARAKPADLVIVGPSFARTDLDPDALGRALARPPLRTTRFAQNLASAPMWYALLKERVYGNGLRPRAVVLVATLDYLLTVRPRAAHMAGLEEHFAEPDAVVRARTWNTRWPAPLQRALDHRGQLRDPLVAWFRDAPVGWAFADAEADGAALVEAAGQALFGGDRTAKTQVRLLPVVEEEADGGPADGMVPDATASYLPDIAALVAANGGRLAIVLPPVAPSVAAEHAVSSSQERSVVALANALGVGLVDLRRVPLTEFDYTDGYHMRPETRKAFTQQVADALTTLGLLGEGPMAAAWVPPAATIVRLGEAAPIEVAAPEATDDPCVVEVALDPWVDLGDNELKRLAAHIPAPWRVTDGGRVLAHAARNPTGCQGGWFQTGGRLRVSRGAPSEARVVVEWEPTLPIRDADGEAAWWIHPGGGVAFTYGEGVPTGPFTLDAEVLLPTGAGQAWITLGGARIPLDEAEGRFRSAHVELPAAPTPLEVRVEADAPAVLRTLVMDIGERRLEPVPPASMRLVDLLDGPVTGTEPPAVKVGRIERKRKRAAFKVPWVDAVACSPIRVYEDGVVLPSGASPVLAKRPKDDATDQVDDYVYLVSTDGTDPQFNGRRYTAALAADRSCRAPKKKQQISRLWVYPGDRLSIEVPAAAGLGKSGPARVLTVDGRWNVPPPEGATVRLRVRVNDKVRLDQLLPAASLATPQDLPLDRPLTGRDREGLRVELEAEGLDTPVLISLIAKEG